MKKKSTKNNLELYMNSYSKDKTNSETCPQDDKSGLENIASQISEKQGYFSNLRNKTKETIRKSLDSLKPYSEKLDSKFKTGDFDYVPMVIGTLGAATAILANPQAMLELYENVTHIGEQIPYLKDMMSSVNQALETAKSVVQESINDNYNPIQNFKYHMITATPAIFTSFLSMALVKSGLTSVEKLNKSIIK